MENYMREISKVRVDDIAEWMSPGGVPESSAEAAVIGISLCGTLFF
jgi:hypothetical protein